MRGAAEGRLERISVAGVGIDPLGLDAARRWVAREAAVDRPRRRVCTVNLDYLVIADRDPAFREALETADLALADGRPVLWLARLAGKRLPERVTGADLTTWLIDGGAPGARLFLLGSTDTVCQAVADRARRHGTMVVGWDASGRATFDDASQSALLVERINAAAPDVLLVALGAPRQDLWLARHAASLDAGVMIGVGGALDLAAGRLRRAPGWIQRLGLEWAFRLVQEPRRLWRRYLVDDLPFLVRQVLATPGRGRSG